MSSASHPPLQQPGCKMLEFKSSLQNALKTLVAFANSAGKYLVIGVDDECQMLGAIAMPIPDKPQSRLQRYRLTYEGRAPLAAPKTKENSAP